MNIARRIWIVFVLGTACTAGNFSSLSQTNPAPAKVQAVSLRECLDLALIHNLDVQIEQSTAEIARYNLNGAYGVYSPDFSFSGGHQYADVPSDVDPKKENAYLPYQLSGNHAGPELDGHLPFGLSYDFNAVAEQDNYLTDFRGFPEGTTLFPPTGIRDTNSTMVEAGVTLRQHLLKDFWIDSDWQSILLRRRDVKISQQALRFLVMQTVLAVELGYDDLIMLREAIRVQEKALQLKQQLVNETRRRLELGGLTPLDAEQAETQLQNTLTALAGARESYQVQQSALKDLLTDNYREWTDKELEPSDVLLAMPETIDLADRFAQAVRNRPDLAEARLGVEKAGVVVRYRVNQLLPSVDLLGRFAGLGSQTNLSTSMSDSLHFRNPEYFYGAVISFPLDNRAERNSYRVSKAARQVAELELKRAEQKVLVEVESWASRVRTRFAQIESTHKARTYAESALAAEEKKLKNGMSTTFVVLQLQEILTAARTAEVQALSDYNKAVGQLAFADGSILERHHLSLQIK